MNILRINHIALSTWIEDTIVSLCTNVTHVLLKEGELIPKSTWLFVQRVIMQNKNARMVASARIGNTTL